MGATEEIERAVGNEQQPADAEQQREGTEELESRKRLAAEVLVKLDQHRAGVAE